jgi:penicillin amidase
VKLEPWRYLFLPFNSFNFHDLGQSGNPDDPHYRDLFEMWAVGKYFPLAYSRPKVESVTESRTVLQPRR